MIYGRLKKKENDAKRRENWCKIAHNACKRIDNEVLECAKNLKTWPDPLSQSTQERARSTTQFHSQIYFDLSSSATQTRHLFGVISVPIGPLASVRLHNFCYVSWSLNVSFHLEDFSLCESIANIPTGGTCSIIQLLYFKSKLSVEQKDTNDWWIGKSLNKL